MTTRQQVGLAVAASVALGLAACGGGGGTPAAPESTPPAADTTTVPPSANASVQSFLDFQAGLKPTDIIEPLKLQQQLPPISDTTEPIPIG